MIALKSGVLLCQSGAALYNEYNDHECEFVLFFISKYMTSHVVMFCELYENHEVNRLLYLTMPFVSFSIDEFMATIQYKKCLHDTIVCDSVTFIITCYADKLVYMGLMCYMHLSLSTLFTTMSSKTLFFSLLRVSC